MEVPFTWKPTGWFQIGWSAEFPTGEVRPCASSVRTWSPTGMSAVRCTSSRGTACTSGHISAMAARWPATASSARTTDGSGDPTARTNGSRIRTARTRHGDLRVWPLSEQYGCVFMWHQPRGEEPTWPMPDVFLSFPQFETDPDAYYPPYPTFVERARA
jgi:3-ketosteroid 9alpha-monooxygenase subunit A